jgi:hypothetical protein
MVAPSVTQIAGVPELLIGITALVLLAAAIATLAVAVKRLLEPRHIPQSYKDDVNEMRATMMAMLEKQETYLRTRFHEIANFLAPLPTQMAVLTKTHEKIETKLEQNVTKLEVLIARTAAADTK